MDLVGRKLGKYEITEFLGQGGMASVYKAFQPGVERHVAIKVLHPHLATSDDFVARFLREARSSGKLHHPHIMPVIDCDSEAGVHYLVLNYIGGDTLEALLKKEKLLPMDQAVQVASQIGEALTYAHEIGMIHRDIKPANIMFLADDAKHALLADFGIARLMDDASNTALTAVGSLVGTPNYMSPEAAQGETSDERSDIYSLGVVLYEMVTGKTPYQADTLYSFLMKQANDPLPPPSELNPNVPPALEAVIVKSLAKEPAERYESAPAFLTALRAAATTGAVPLTQTIRSAAAAADEPKKRSMLPLLLAALGVLAVAGGTTFFMLNMGGPGELPSDPPADLAAPTEVAGGTVATQASESAGDTSGDTTNDEPTTEQTDSESAVENGEEAVGDADDATAATEESTAESAGGGDDAGAAADVDSPDQDSPDQDSPNQDESVESDKSSESLAEVTDATAAVTTVVRKIGQLQIQTGSDGDGVNLSLAQMPLPPADSHYELWLGDSAGAVLNLGPLQLVDNAVAFNAEIPEGVLSDYASVMISRELDTDENSDEIDSIVISSTAPSQLLPATDLAADLAGGDSSGQGDLPADAAPPDAWVIEALLGSALEQSTLAETHVGFLQASLAEEDLDAVRMHAEHVVNILIGEDDERFGDLDRDGLSQNPGDGVGVLGYLGTLTDLADLFAPNSPDDESITTAVDTLAAVAESSETTIKRALQVFAADTLAEIQPISERLLGHVAELKDGVDSTAGGQPLMAFAEMVGAIPAAVPVQVARFELMVQSAMLTDVGAETTLLTDAASAGSFHISLVEKVADDVDSEEGDGYEYNSSISAQSDIAYTSFYTIEISTGAVLGEGEVYEAWGANESGDLLLLGTAESDGALYISGRTDALLLAEYDQILLTRRAADAASPSAASDIADAIVYRGQYDAALRRALQTLYYAGDLSESGLLKAATDQLALASTHTGFSQGGINDDELSEARRHSEHVINILLGEEGEFYGDIDGDGLPQNPGDGIGAQVYLQMLQETLLSAAQASEVTPEQLFALDRSLASLQNSSVQSNGALKKALQVFAADTLEEADPIVRELGILLMQANMGTDVDGNGLVDPVEAEGGLTALGGYMSLLSELPLYDVE